MFMTAVAYFNDPWIDGSTIDLQESTRVRMLERREERLADLSSVKPARPWIRDEAAIAEREVRLAAMSCR